MRTLSMYEEYQDYFKAYEECMDYINNSDSVSEIDNFPNEMKDNIEVLKQYSLKEGYFCGLARVRNSWDYKRKQILK